jgi:DNA-binding CsgD family transcriptional regulator
MDGNRPQSPALGGYLLKERVTDFNRVDRLVVEALLAQPDSARTLGRLTRRESEVLAELATGGSNRAVAQRLVLTQRAVEKHINSIFAKLGLTGDDSVDRRVKAVLMFLEGSAICDGSAQCRTTCMTVAGAMSGRGRVPDDTGYVGVHGK